MNPFIMWVLGFFVGMSVGVRAEMWMHKRYCEQKPLPNDEVAPKVKP